MFRLLDLAWYSLDIPMTKPFGIAGGAQASAQNGLVVAELEHESLGRSRGLGEAAPFPAVNGETQAAARGAFAELRRGLTQAAQEPDEAAAFPNWQAFSRSLPQLAETPTARCAVEMAVMDACLRLSGSSLWEQCGATQLELTTDITIATGSSSDAERDAKLALESGFSTLKIKVGGGDLAQDALRVRAAAGLGSATHLVLDGNAAFSVDQALRLLDALGPCVGQVCLFEQPTPKSDFDGLAEVERRSGIPVAADESCQSLADLGRLRGGVSVVNLKLMKSGVLGVIELAAEARRLGFGLMMGGMVESRLAMGTAAAIAAGYGGFAFIDLDTPLWLAADPFTGGYLQRGAKLELPENPRGHATDLSVEWAAKLGVKSAPLP